MELHGKNTRNKIKEINSNYVVKHFKESEYACKDGCGFKKMEIRLLKIMDSIRDYYNSPFIITSGCRCGVHNKRVGGTSNSRHIQGKAVDFYIKNVDTSKVLSHCKTLVSKGDLRYTYGNSGTMKGCVHIDIL